MYYQESSYSSLVRFVSCICACMSTFFKAIARLLVLSKTHEIEESTVTSPSAYLLCLQVVFFHLDGLSSRPNCVLGMFT